MRQLVIHAGLPKTGSSALQVALARHGDYLEQQGVHYPDLGSVAAARAGATTSGNGASIAAFLNGNDQHQVSMETCLKAIAEAPRPKVLLSSELFYSARPDRLAGFLERVRTAGFEPRVVFFVRSLYEWAWSAYVQNVKNHGVSDPFADWVVTSRIGDAIPSTLRKFRAAAGAGNVVLLNYDAFRADVFAAFATHGLRAGDSPPPTSAPGRINRSLSPSEIDALRAFNLIRHGRSGGKQLSDALVAARPQLEVPSVPLHPAALELLQARYDGVREATAEAVGGPVQLRSAEDEGPTGTDNPEEVDRILALLVYSRALDNAALLQQLRDKIGTGDEP